MAFRRVPAALRGVALMPIAAFAVHQLRYVLAFGGNAPHELASQGHAYLDELTPWIVLCAGLGVGALLGRVAAAWRTPSGSSSTRRGFLAVWASSALALLAIYVGQELLEGWFAAGHPVGLVGVFGSGGWMAIPAACCVGMALAAALHVTEALVARFAACRPARPGYGSLRIARRRRTVLTRMTAPLASGAAGRAPPVRA